MASVQKSTFTVAEYLAQEALAELKHEYYRGEIFAMSGASLAHNTIAMNIAYRLRGQLACKECHVVGSDMRVRTADDFFTYPDFSIYCGTARLDGDKPPALLNPRVIIEVLSDSTEAYDRGKKFQLYGVIPSLREYVLVAQDRVGIDRFERNDDDSWRWTTKSGIDDEMPLPSIGCVLQAAQVYEGVTFSETSPKS